MALDAKSPSQSSRNVLLSGVIVIHTVYVNVAMPMPRIYDKLYLFRIIITKDEYERKREEGEGGLNVLLPKIRHRAIHIA